MGGRSWLLEYLEEPTVCTTCGPDAKRGEEGVGSPVIQITDGCEWPLGAGHRTQVLCKIR